MAALCKLLTTYLVCRTFYNPNEPLHIYVHAWCPPACTCRSQIRPAVSLVQEGGKFYDCCSSNNLAFSFSLLFPFFLCFSPFLAYSTYHIFHLSFSPPPSLSLSLSHFIPHRPMKLHTLCRFYVSSGFSVPVRCHYTPHKAEHYRPAIFSPETRYH